MFRQGDILLIEAGEPGALRSISVTPDRLGRFILAEGEATGHVHAVTADSAVLVETGTQRFLLVTGGGVELTHDEHAAIHIPAGTWRVVRQRESDSSWKWNRLVSD